MFSYWKSLIAHYGLTIIRVSSMRPITSTLLLLLFLSVSFSVVYTPITKVDLEDGAIGDAKAYIAIYNGKSLKEIPKPFCYRFPVPYLARLIPTPPAILIGGFEIDSIKIIKFKFGVVNSIGLALTAWVLFFFCGKLGFDRPLSMLGSFLFFTSFYVLNYAGLPYIDAIAYFFLISCLYLILANRNLWLFMFFTIGIFVKETVVLVIVYVVMRDASLKQKLKKIILFLPGLLAYFLMRVVVMPSNIGYDYSTRQIMTIIKHYSSGLAPWVFAAINIVFVFGFLWVLAYKGFQIAKQQKHEAIIELLPIVLVALITPFIIASDLGRIWFLGFPAIIPLSLLGIKHYFLKT